MAIALHVESQHLLRQYNLKYVSLIFSNWTMSPPALLPDRTALHTEKLRFDNMWNTKPTEFTLFWESANHFIFHSSKSEILGWSLMLGRRARLGSLRQHRSLCTYSLAEARHSVCLSNSLVYCCNKMFYYLKLLKGTNCTKFFGVKHYIFKVLFFWLSIKLQHAGIAV